MFRVSVIGAGTMGSGIAAHLANLGFEVDLFDLTQESAEAALTRAQAIKPPHFFGPEALARIRLGGIDQDLARISESDWVCEAIVEKLDLKRSLYDQLIPHLKPEAMVSTNTSGLELKLLADGKPETFRRKFLGTHFFNPPRYLKLLELIPTDETDTAEIDRVTQFLENEVGRRVVLAKDTPGFIANRFGMWAMLHAIHVTEKLGLSIEQVDAMTGPFLGRPRSASFRLNDLVGLDIMADIASNLYERCPSDPFRENLQLPKSMQLMIEKNWIGAKVGQGYYRREGKELLVLDLRTHAYRNVNEVELPSLTANAKAPLGERIRAVLNAQDEAGEFMRHYLVPVLQYADYLKEEISHSVQAFDRVMMWGFGWESGPFAMMDAIGHNVLGVQGGSFYSGATMRSFDGGSEPVRDEPEYWPIQRYPIVESYDGWQARELGDGVTAVCLNSKMGVINPDMVRTLTKYLPTIGGPIVLCGETKAFSAGFNLQFFLDQIQQRDFEAVDAALNELQQLTVLISTLPIVAAVHGYCLGAGLELAMACPLVIAHPEAQLGLPEAKVGLIPGGAGTCRMRLRYQTSAKDLADGAMLITKGHTCSNAAEAVRVRYLRRTDQILSHPDRLISDAKKLAMQVEPLPAPMWLQVEGPAGGMIDQLQKELIQKGELTGHDEQIGDRIKAVFTKEDSFEKALVRERAEFIAIMQNALSISRIRHMIETGKPLRN